MLSVLRDPVTHRARRRIRRRPRLSAQGLGAAGSPEAGAAQLPDAVAGPFADAMQQAMLLPLAVYAVGLVIVMFYEAPKHQGYGAAPTPAPVS